jgi:hypothetical protein
MIACKGQGCNHKGLQRGANRVAPARVQSIFLKNHIQYHCYKKCIIDNTYYYFKIPILD